MIKDEPNIFFYAEIVRVIITGSYECEDMQFGQYEQHTTLHKVPGTLWFPGRVNSACSISATHRFTLVKHPVVVQECGNCWILITTNIIYPWSFVTQVYNVMVVFLLVAPLC